MNGDPTQQPINLLLSREELLLVLKLLGVETIPGLDADPQGALDAGQQAVALRVAERALRARALADVRDGQVALHNALISAVGTCAFPQRTVFVYHWPAGGEEAIRYFGHLRGDEVVVHTRPADVLHLFSRMPSAGYFAEQMLAACAVTAAEPAVSGGFTLASAAFTRLRQLAEGGSTQAALDLLRQTGIDATGAGALVATLAHNPAVSIVQMRKQQDGAVAGQEFTLLQNSQHAWLVQLDASATERPLQVQPASRQTVERLLSGWLA